MAYYRYMKKKSVMKPNFPRSKQSTEIQDFYSSFFSVSVIKQCDQNIFVEVGVIRIKGQCLSSSVMTEAENQIQKLKQRSARNTSSWFALLQCLASFLREIRTRSPGVGTTPRALDFPTSLVIFSQCSSDMLTGHSQSQCFYRVSFLHMSS